MKKEEIDNEILAEKERKEYQEYWERDNIYMNETLELLDRHCSRAIRWLLSTGEYRAKRPKPAEP
jgi:hypothetical protein